VRTSIPRSALPNTHANTIDAMATEDSIEKPSPHRGVNNRDVPSPLADCSEKRRFNRLKVGYEV